MDSSGSFFTLIVTLLLFSSFIKVATVLSVFRYGAGLVGIEFGVVCLVVAFGIAILDAPLELKKVGYPELFFSGAPQPDVAAVTKSLTPRMVSGIDQGIARALYGPDAVPGEGALKDDLKAIAPAFLFSQLKEALTLGVMLLIPFVALDLLVAHLLALIGMQQLGVQVVSMPLKLLLFLTVNGWGLFASKVLGLGG